MTAGMKHWLGVVMIVAACGGPGATSPGSTGAPSAGAKTQQVITEIPAAGGSKATANELPDGVSLPTASPESMVAPQRPESTSAAPTTMLVGQAWYAGPACGWTAWPPQCNGPYHATWVWIWSHSTGSWLRAARTDDWGRYTFYVEPGWYTIMFQTGFGDEWWHAKVSVAPFETTTQNLIVDHGAR